MNAVALDAVLKHPGIWRRSASASHHVRAIPTGLSELDAQLPGGGWPCGSLSEILFAHDGLGELSLLMPALAELTRKGQRVVFVAPPYIPYAPALAAHGLDLRYVVQIDANAGDGAWSAEQCLRSGSCGAVLAWMQQADYTQLRRLQLAAESGDAIAFLFRPARTADKASPPRCGCNCTRMPVRSTSKSSSAERSICAAPRACDAACELKRLTA